MKFDRDTRRKLFSHVVSVACLLCVGIAIIPLGSILYESVLKGIVVINWSFFTENQPLPCNPQFQSGCQFGGIFNSIEGTLLLIGISAAIALPLGILGGIYLSEFGRHRFGDSLRFFADVLTGVPSIVVGIVVFSLFFLLAQDGLIPTNYTLSVLSAGVALSFIMIPIVTRTCEEALALVPTSTREAALALGVPKWKAVTSIVLSTGRSAVLTGALLAIARATGETAPLIILDAGSQFSFQPSAGLHQPTSSLPFSIYNWVQSAYPNWIADAWGATLVLVVLMLGISVAARLALRNKYGEGGVV
jgi:phosphate transport system permease protein